MEQPLVSVLTVTRNRGNLLRRCVNSVLSQTYKNIEHIVVDGASDDNTDEVMAEFNDERLYFVKLKSNWPIKETLDHGISLCKGKYITFLDSDDEYLPEKVEKQVRLIESLSEDYGFVYCWMTYYDDKTKKELRLHSPHLRGFVADKVISTPVISGTPTLMFRVEVLRELKGWKSPDETGIISDWELCSRACQHYNVDFIPESLVNVYVNHGSIRQSESNKYYTETSKRIVKFHKYFLNRYQDFFNKFPKNGWYHYSGLLTNYLVLGNYKESRKYYWLLCKSRPSLSSFISPLKPLIKKILRWK